MSTVKRGKRTASDARRRGPERREDSCESAVTKGKFRTPSEQLGELKAGELVAVGHGGPLWLVIPFLFGTYVLVKCIFRKSVKSFPYAPVWWVESIRWASSTEKMNSVLRGE